MPLFALRWCWLQVWSVHTGLLLVSARGHTGEITDLSLSCDGELLASGATDAEVRVWSMKVCCTPVKTVVGLWLLSA